ncbi:HprK-related kinase A [Alteromonas gracilis]|uniref:HprK-related kinase A n=1 Tax=Alteromonas gracilis TaxID=1479524 RepID=UPI00321B9D9C
MIRSVEQMYGDHHLETDGYDFAISVTSPSALRRFIAPQISFYCDKQAPFFPLPRKQSYPLLEWGMNWCIAAHEYSRLVIHSAVLVKNGKAILFPALPGSGKSTLSALLSEMGWSVYSDEMAIIELDSLNVKPINRPVCLKNDAIDIVKSSFSNSVFTEKFYDTQKGTVAHKRVHTQQSFKLLEDMPIGAVVFPKYIRGEATRVQQVTSAEGILQVIRNAFNYHVMAEKGFEALVNLADRVEFFSLEYSDIDSAEEALTELLL